MLDDFRRTLLPPLLRTASPSAKHIGKPTSSLTTTEQVIHIEPATTLTRTTPATAAHITHLVGVLPIVTELVVIFPMSRITHNLVRLIYLLELVLSALVVRIHIRMKLSGHPSVSRLDFFFGGAFIHPE